MACGGAHNVECSPFGLALGGEGGGGDLWRVGQWDVCVTGRAVVIEIGLLEEERRACVSAVEPADRGK